MFGIAMGNRAFKIKKIFLEKASFLSFSHNCVLTIFKVKKSEVFLEFFYQTCQLFVWHNF